MSYYDVFSPKARRKLEDIEVEEVSLVDKAANGRTFAIMKRSLEALAPEALEFIKDETLEKDAAEAKEAIEDGIKRLSKYNDDYPPDVLKAIKTLAKWAAASYGYPEKAADDEAGGESYGYPLGGKRPRKKPKLEKGVDLWPSLVFIRGELRKTEPAEDAEDGDDGTESRRGVSKSKQVREQVTSVDEPDECLWPSLAG